MRSRFSFAAAALCLCAAVFAALPALAQVPPPIPGQPPNMNAPGIPGPGGAPGAADEEIKETGTEINVKNAELASIIKIFSRKTKRNYILDDRVKGKVSIYLPGKVSPGEALRILDSVLSFKGFTSVPIGENLWKIVPAKDARQTTIPTKTGEKANSDGATAAMVTRLVNLKYVNADDMKQILQPLVSGDGLINAYTGTNALIIIDSDDNIQRLMHIVENLDVPFSNREMTIIAILHADAEDIADKLNAILGEAGEGKESSGGDAARARMVQAAVRAPNPFVPPGGNVQQPGQGSPGTTVSARSLSPKIIADQRTNSIIVVADDETTARIRALIAQLDSKIDLSGNKFYVYRCQYANADELAGVLSGLVGGGGSSGGTGTGSSNRDLFGGNSGSSGDSRFNFGSQTRRNNNSRDRGSQFSSTQDRMSGQQRTPGRSRSENGKGAGSAGSVQLGDNISITADPATNSLVIIASKTDYQKILQLLEKLDIKRRQVLVEAMLLEVGVTDSSKNSFDFLGSVGGKDGGILGKNDSSGNLAQLFADPTKLSDFSVAAASSGTLTLPNNITIPTQTVLLNAAQSNSNVNVLSAPTILATDNEQAEIVVGQNVPFLASTATSGDNLNNTFNQIDRQDVGITLRLTPQISSGESVKLNMFTEVSSVLSVTPQLGPTTTIRTSETTVIAKDGQMIVIGGLMSDDISDGNAGVPFLKDVPVLGHFFRADTSDRRRTNLLIFITPRVIKDQFDARDVTLKNRRKMEDVIASGDVFPDRRELLTNPDADNVIEASPYEGLKPGTILPPSKKGTAGRSPAIKQSKIEPRPMTQPEVAAAQPEEASAPAATSEQPKDPAVIELRVAPKLPGEDTDSARPSLRSSKFAQPDVESGADSAAAAEGLYVVLERQGKGPLPAALPFHAPPKGRYVGIVVPAQSDVAAKNFFQSGSVYHYGSDKDQVTLTAMGIFGSAKEAAEYYKGLGKEWYLLSPYEVMNLGSGPWHAEH